MKRLLCILPAAVLLAAGCSMISRQGSGPEYRLSGVMELEITTASAPLWPGGDFVFTLDFERGLWHQRPWLEEGRSPLPFTYSLRGRQLHLELPSAAGEVGRSRGEYRELFLIQVDGAFDKIRRRENLLVGPMKGIVRGFRVSWDRTEVGELEYRRRTLAWEGIAAAYPLAGDERTDTIRFSEVPQGG